MIRHALGELIAPAGVMFDLAGASKQVVLATLASQAALLAGRDPAEVVAVIMEREALGSTGFGAGTAIPHGRLADLPEVIAVAARLAVPIDYAALDAMPVDLIVLMLSPITTGSEHLKALARVSRALRDTHFCARLRQAPSATAFHAVLADDRGNAGA